MGSFGAKATSAERRLNDRYANSHRTFAKEALDGPSNKRKTQLLSVWKRPRNIPRPTMRIGGTTRINLCFGHHRRLD